MTPVIPTEDPLPPLEEVMEGLREAGWKGKGTQDQDRDMNDYTAFVCASRQNRLDWMQVLAAHGADVNAKTRHGFRPFFFFLAHLLVTDTPPADWRGVMAFFISRDVVIRWEHPKPRMDFDAVEHILDHVVFNRDFEGDAAKESARERGWQVLECLFHHAPFAMDRLLVLDKLDDRERYRLGLLMGHAFGEGVPLAQDPQSCTRRL